MTEDPKYPPNFKPEVTPTDMLAEGQVLFYYVELQFDDPLPYDGQYGQSYKYGVDVIEDGKREKMSWWATETQHKQIQAEGAIKGTILKVARPSEKAKYIIKYHGGPKRDEGQGGTVTAPTPATPPPTSVNGGTRGATTATTTQATTVATTATTQPQPNIYVPKIGNEPDYWKLMEAVGNDYAKLRRVAYDVAEEAFADVVKGMNKNEKVRFLVDLSAPLNMMLKDKSYHLWENGTRTIVGEPLPDPSTRDGALDLIKALDATWYDKKDDFIREYVKYIVLAHDSLKESADVYDVMKMLGVSSDVLYSDNDTEHNANIAEATWFFVDQRDKGDARDNTLRNIAFMFGLPADLMDFEDAKAKQEVIDAQASEKVTDG